MRKSRLFRLGAVAVGLSLVAVACGDDDEDSGSADTIAEPEATTAAPEATDAPATEGGVTCEGIKLAFFGALTGDAANLGINIKKGAQLKIDEFNTANPGCQVELVELDSQGSPDQAPALAKSAIDDAGVVGIIGPAFSGESEAANPLFEEAGLPIITPSATRPTLSENGWTIFHRMLASDALQGPAAAQYISETIGSTQVFVVDDATPYGLGLADIVRENLGDAVIGNDQVQEGQTDFAATVTKVKDSGADTVFYGGYYAEAGLFVKQLRDAGVEAAFVAGDGVKDPGFIEAAGAEAAEGAIVTCPCGPPEDFVEFFAAYEAKFGEAPQTYGAEAYDAATAFLALIADGAVTREAILAGLATLDIPGVTKQIKWDEVGEVADTTVYAYRVEAGVIVGAGPIK
jgi:branched-chain amino acid transport system substrate-binding protein